MKKTRHFFVFALFTTLIVWGCKKDKPSCDGSDPNYNEDIRSIINANCATSNCHPSYSTYAGLESILDNGDFKKEVLEKQSMPKNKDLSSDQLNLLQCWVENGYKEAP